MSKSELPSASPFAENAADRWARNFRIGLPTTFSVAGPLGAVAGPILGEILASTIPNQRLDRMAVYLEKVRQALPDEKLERIRDDNERLGLMEEGLYAASFSTQRSRIERIASVVVNGLDKESLDFDRATHLLNLVTNLSDVDVILLHRYKVAASRNWQALHAFDMKHREVVPAPPSDYSADKDVREANAAKQSLFKSHVNILYSAGLLEEDGQKRLPKMGRSLSGNISEMAIARYVADIAQVITEQRYRVSSLGQELLESLSYQTFEESN